MDHPEAVVNECINQSVCTVNQMCQSSTSAYVARDIQAQTRSAYDRVVASMTNRWSSYLNEAVPGATSIAVGIQGGVVSNYVEYVQNYRGSSPLFDYDQTWFWFLLSHVKR